MYHSDNRLQCNKSVTSAFIQHISKREQQVLILTATGLNPAHIADNLNISSATVTQHLRNIRVKLNVRNTTHAVAHAITNGIIRI